MEMGTLAICISFRRCEDRFGEAGVGRLGCGPGRHGRAGARRDVVGPEPEAGQRVAEFVTICSGGKAELTLLLPGNDGRSDIQPRVEACVECVSFPHTSQDQRPGS